MKVRKLDKMKRIADDTALLAFSGSCNRTVTRTFKPLPTIWGSPSTSAVGGIVIFANLGRDGNVAATMNTHPTSLPGRCEYLPGGGVAYDWKCSFNFAGLQVKTTEAVITQTLFEDRSYHRITINLGD